MAVIPDVAVGIGLSVISLAIGISALAVIPQKQELDNAANNVARIIETDGGYDSAKVQSYLNKIGVQATVQYTTDSGSGTLDLGDGFTVVLSHSMRIGAGGIGFTPITLYGKAAGESEVYNK